jgi:hypothetical protein
MRWKGRCNHKHTTKLDPKALGLTCSALWGIGLFSLTWWVMAFDGASRHRTSISRVYRGYLITPRGSFVGLMWAIVDGFMGGLCFAWLCNHIAGHHKCR